MLLTLSGETPSGVGRVVIFISLFIGKKRKSTSLSLRRKGKKGKGEKALNEPPRSGVEYEITPDSSYTVEKKKRIESHSESLQEDTASSSS